MNCNQCQGIEEFFDQDFARKELENYRKKGPDKTTRILIQAIQEEGVAGLSLLDIGGGVGAVQHALIDLGVDHATDVDASKAYLQVARAETQRRNRSDRIRYHHGNFIELADEIPPADIVTLDRVICCYPDVDQLVGLSSERAQQIYGLVYPRETWWVRIAEALGNFYFKLKRSPFRMFIQSTQAVEALLNAKGFIQSFHYQDLFWQVAVYTRSSTHLTSE